jgi:Tol biopolymer transport system component
MRVTWPTMVGVLLASWLTACSSSARSTVSQSSPLGSSTSVSITSTTVVEGTLAPGDAGALRLVFQSGGRVHTELADGSSVVDVAPGAPDGQEHPDWSHDGTRLVFETAFSKLWTVKADGTELTSLIDCVAPCHNLFDGAWSPDGKEIAFVVAETKDGTNTSRSAIVVLNVASGQVRTVYEDVSGRVWLFQPRWSSDGKSMVFEEDTYDSALLDGSRITGYAVKVVASVGGSAPVKVAAWATPSSGDPPQPPAPDWSRTDDLLVFSRDDNLFTVRPDGTAATQITQFDGQHEHAIQPTFTPDGTSIVFTLVTGQFHVNDQPTPTIIGLVGHTLTRLGGTGLITHPRIQP